MSTAPFQIIGQNRPGPWVVTCDHASNRVPDCTNGGCLGLPAHDMSRHIAYDVGAAGVTRALAQYLDSPAVLSNFSRLVIDPNRGEDDPTLLMKLYDGTLIPANRHADGTEIGRRLNAFHRPYHDALTAVLAARSRPVILSVHSFTPQLAGRPPRPWHIGILSASDRRLADPTLARLAQHGDLCVGDNEPYLGELPGDAMDRHALQHDRLHLLLELRNDLIETEPQQYHWAERLAPIFTAALADVTKLTDITKQELAHG